MNWYFIAASVIILLPAVYWVTMKFVIPRLGKFDTSDAQIEVDSSTQDLTPQESRALMWANIGMVVVLVGIILCALPHNSFLRNAKTEVSLTMHLYLTGSR